MCIQYYTIQKMQEMMGNQPQEANVFGYEAKCQVSRHVRVHNHESYMMFVRGIVQKQLGNPKQIERNEIGEESS